MSSTSDLHLHVAFDVPLVDGQKLTGAGFGPHRLFESGALIRGHTIQEFVGGSDSSWKEVWCGDIQNASVNNNCLQYEVSRLFSTLVSFQELIRPFGTVSRDRHHIVILLQFLE